MFHQILKFDTRGKNKIINSDNLPEAIKIIIHRRKMKLTRQLFYKKKSLINERGVFLVTPPFSVKFKTSQFDWKSLINERGVFLVTPPFYVDFQSRSIWLEILDKWKGGIFSHPLNLILDINVNEFDWKSFWEMNEGIFSHPSNLYWFSKQICWLEILKKSWKKI